MRGMRVLPIAVLALLASACSSLVGPVPSGGATIGMVNATTVPVSVHVNGTWVGTFPAMSEQRQIVVVGHGGPPWRVEFFDPDGGGMGYLDVSMTSEGSGTGWSSSCGQFVAWYQTPPNDIPPLDPAKMRPANPPCR